MVLIEICELIVEQHGRAHVFGNLKLYRTILGGGIVAVVRDGDVLTAPLYSQVGLVLELGIDVASRDGSKVIGWSIPVACRVVDAQFLYL